MNYKTSVTMPAARNTLIKFKGKLTKFVAYG
jgi:hypothetical protein